LTTRAGRAVELTWGRCRMADVVGDFPLLHHPKLSTRIVHRICSPTAHNSTAGSFWDFRGLKVNAGVIDRPSLPQRGQVGSNGMSCCSRLNHARPRIAIVKRRRVMQWSLNHHSERAAPLAILSSQRVERPLRSGCKPAKPRKRKEHKIYLRIMRNIAYRRGAKVTVSVSGRDITRYSICYVSELHRKAFVF
jgi:hypothetical protein